jgi:hypothetical protein
MAQPAGPTTEAEWTTRTASGFAPLLVRPSDGSGAGYAVAAHHRVVVDEEGDPVFSLALVLDGVPDPAEHDITPRVCQGTLAFRLALDAPVEALAAMGLRPLYVREGTTGLFAGPAAELATGPVSGTSTGTSLNVTLDRDQTLAVLAALAGEGESLCVSSTLWYRAVEPPTKVHLTGSWAEVHDVLVEQRGPADLERLFADALAAGAVVADPPERPAGALSTFVSMARAVLLDRDGLIGARPTPYFALDIDAKSAGTGVDRYLNVSTPLRDVLGECLTGRDRSKFVSVHALSGGGLGETASPVGVPRRVTTSRVSRGEIDMAAPKFAQRANGQLVSLPKLLGAVRPSTGHLSAQLADVADAGRRGATLSVALGDIVDMGGGQLDLPVVTDANASTFIGRSGDPEWYLPTFEVVMPRADQDASESPFVFAFTRTGTTLAGLPGLVATVTLRLRTAAPEGAASLRLVPIRDVSVVLDLPFRDAQGHDQRQRFSASAEWDGEDVVATVELIDDWARMAYGALSRPDFQSSPARIGVTWSFTGCELVAVKPESVVSGGKTAIVPVIYTKVPKPEHIGPHEGPRPEELYVDATTSTLKTPHGSYQFHSHTDELVSGAADVVIRAGLRAPTLRAVRSTLVAFRPRPGLIHVNGAVDSPAVHIYEQPMRSLQRTYVRAESLDVLFPCDEFGACYLEHRSEGPVAVGCQDTLRLGQAEWRQYEEITALADPAYRIFRSLQQPGRFVVLPKRFVVARRSAGDLGAWQPAILLYSLIDAEDPNGNQVVVDTTLAPDVPPWAMASLRAALRHYAPDPIVELATDVECTPAFTWTVVGIDAIHINATLVAGGLRVGIQSDLAHALLVRDMLEHSGLSGAMTLQLPDGTEMRSAVQVDLRAQAGPEPKGPLELSATNRRLTVVNRIERPVNLTAVRVEGGASTLTEVAVEVSLAPGESTTLDLAAVPPADLPIDPDRCWPVYALPDVDPSTLVEIRSYVEDIRMNVVFFDLIDHESRAVTRVDVAAQLRGVGDPQPVLMSGNPALGPAMFVLPLTTYLGAREVTYQVTVTGADGSTQTSRWLIHDAAANGSLINLTWDGLGFPQQSAVSNQTT